MVRTTYRASKFWQGELHVMQCNSPCCVSGDYTGSQPCLTNTYDGVLYNVYYTNDLVGNNDEVIW